jgi:hypothetical protein
VPVFPLVAGKKVPYHGSRGHLDATTAPGRIREWWSEHPKANIGGRTGRISGLLVLDVDSTKALATLQREFSLPDTLTATTPSGGLHLYFHMPNVGINSAANVLQDLIGPGLDVRADGGMVVLPPSETPEGPYTVAEAHPLAEIPAELVEALVEDCGGERGASTGSNRTIPYVADGEPIPDGARNATLTSCAGRLHDGTRSRDDLIEALLAVPTETPVPRHEVEKIAGSIFEREACRPGRGGDLGDGNAEVAEILERAGDYWYDKLLPGGGKSKERDVYTAFLSTAAKHGKVKTVSVNGHQRRAVEFKESCRQTAETAKTKAPSVGRAAKKLEEHGAMISRSTRRDTEGTTRLIVEPATNRYSPNHPAENVAVRGVDMDCNDSSRPPVPPRPDRLETPYFRAGGYVGNAKAGTLYALEAFGWQTDAELADRVDYSRVRDYRRNHLHPLIELGLVVERGGLYGLAAEIRETTEEIRNTRYSTERKHLIHRHDPTSGRIVTEVREVGSYASEVERDEKAVQDHNAERERFLLNLKQREEDERHADELLCAWDEETGLANVA